MSNWRAAFPRRSIGHWISAWPRPWAGGWHIIGLSLAFCVASHAQMPQPFPDLTQSQSCTAACTTPVITTSGRAQVNIQATGTGATMAWTVQGTMDGGVTWQTLACVVPTTPGTFVASFSVNGYWSCSSAGWQQVRVNLSAIASGTETFALEATQFGNVNIGQ